MNETLLYSVSAVQDGSLIMIAPEATIQRYYSLHELAVKRFRAEDCVLHGNGKHPDVKIEYYGKMFSPTGRIWPIARS